MRKCGPVQKSRFRSRKRVRSFPHPFSRINAKALRSLTIERGTARDGALCIRVTAILHCLQEAFLMEGCLVTRNTVRAPLRTRAGPLHYIQDLLSPLCQRSKWPSENRVA